MADFLRTILESDSESDFYGSSQSDNESDVDLGVDPDRAGDAPDSAKRRRMAVSAVY